MPNPQRVASRHPLGNGTRCATPKRTTEHKFVGNVSKLGTDPFPMNMLCLCERATLGLALLGLTSDLKGLASEADDFGFSAEGVLTVSNRTEGVGALESSYEFSVTVSNGLWRMESFDENLTDIDGTSLQRRIIAGTDGKDVYIMTRIGKGTSTGASIDERRSPRDPVPVIGAASTLDREAKQHGYVTAGTKPGFDRNLQLVWFALLSSRYLDQYGASGILPFWYIEGIKRTHHYDVELVRDRNSPRLPSFARFLCPSGVGKEENVEGEFQVTAWTDLVGITVPVVFEFRQYDVKTHSVPDASPTVLRTWNGFIRATTNLASVKLLPRPATSVLITDYRFHDKNLNIDALRYKLPREEWLSHSNLTLQKQFDNERRAVQAGMVPIPQNETRRTYAAMLMVIVAVISGAVIIFAIKRRKEQ